MAFKYEKKPEYDSISFKLKDLEVGNPIKIRLAFDEPKTGEGKYGAWFLFSCEVLEPEAHPRASFFAPNKVAEELKKFKRGAVVTITNEFRKGQRGPYTHYEIQAQEDATPSAPNDRKAQIVDLLVKNSNGQMQSPVWVKEQLSAVGVDDSLVAELVQEYSGRW